MTHQVIAIPCGLPKQNQGLTWIRVGEAALLVVASHLTLKLLKVIPMTLVAAARYGLELTTASTKGVDAHHEASGRSVEIKATMEGKRISLRGMEPKADHLLVLRINGDGSASEVFNGPAAPAWVAAGRMQSNGQRVVSVSRLMALQTKVSADQRPQEVS